MGEFLGGGVIRRFHVREHAQGRLDRGHGDLGYYANNQLESVTRYSDLSDTTKVSHSTYLGTFTYGDTNTDQLTADGTSTFTCRSSAATKAGVGGSYWLLFAVPQFFGDNPSEQTGVPWLLAA